MERKNLKLAGAMNSLLPGLGLIYLGRPVAGLILAVAFLGCFLTLAALFLAGYSQYLSAATSDDLIQGDGLDRAGEAFPLPRLIGLALGGGAIYLVSSILFSIAKRRVES